MNFIVQNSIIELLKKLFKESSRAVITLKLRKYYVRISITRILITLYYKIVGKWKTSKRLEKY